MIEGKDLCKQFDGFCVLDHLQFHVKKGSVYGLVGPNGAGKSTLLRHVMGILKADSGEILLDGEPVFENQRAKSRMAFIPDDVFYFHQASILDMKQYYQGIYDSFDEELFDKIMEGFPELNAKLPIRRMSKGMQKQAAFVLAISTKPEILVLDEPVDGLDPVMRRQIWSILLSAVSEEQMTVLVSSHNLRELEDVCDYVGIMHHGKVILEHSLSEMQGNISKVQLAFDGELPDVSDRFEVLHTDKTGKVYTLIIKGEPQEVLDRFATYHPLLMDLVPLSLEEIFIYELEGMEYEVKDIVF